MDRDNQGPTVFDINKPHTYGAGPSARPVITGHQPQMPDPMVTPPQDAGSKINVRVDGSDPPSGINADSLANSLFPKSEPVSVSEKNSVPPGTIEAGSVQSLLFKPDGEHEAAAQNDPFMPTSDSTSINTSSNPTPRPVGSEISDSDQQVTIEPKPGVFGANSSHAMEEPSPPKEPKKHSKVWLWPVLIFIILAGLYAAIDKGVILSNVNLPFHIFNQPNQINNNASQPTDTAPAASLPAGFTATKLIEAGLSFAYPTDWGAPAAAVDQGFVKRTKDGKADTPHAYVVTFPNNKDVELSVTSGKILSQRSVAQYFYYDPLGWCIGSVDGKYYAGQLLFNTENNIDTPSTVACGALSLPNATKLNNDTVVQKSLKTTDGKDAGDLYTKNLTNTNFVVAHVRDATMKNAEQIKTMLGSIENLQQPTTNNQ